VLGGDPRPRSETLRECAKPHWWEQALACFGKAFLSQAPDNLGFVEAQAWTAIGLLAATLVGSLFYLGNRIDSLGARLNARIDGLSGSLGSRIDGLSGSLSGRIDGLAGRIDGLTVRVEDQGHQLSTQIYELAGKLDDHLRRHAS
jgi:hypothetical protein